jgi:hypothetical protein
LVVFHNIFAHSELTSQRTWLSRQSGGANLKLSNPRANLQRTVE